MPTTSHDENKDNKGLEEARIKRMKEQEVKRKKSKLEMDLISKKRFLLSNTSMLDAKRSLLQQLMPKQRTVEGELERLRRQIEQINRDITQLSGDHSALEGEINRLEADIRNT